MRKFVLIAFVLVSLGVLVSTVVDAYLFHRICKPLIMITLGTYYWTCIEQEHRSRAVLIAVFFSCLGDVLLMLQSKELYFMLGLGAFLIAHIFYIFSYRQHRNEEHPDQLQGVQKIRLAFPVILAGSGLIVILYPVLGGLKVPVLVYAIVLVIMVLNALFRYGRTNSKSYWMVFGGAVLFMISDSLIAINKFLSPVSQAGLLIMSSYIAAQFLIISGILKHKATS